MKVSSLLLNRRTWLSLLAAAFVALLIGQYLTRGGDSGSAAPVVTSASAALVDQTPLVTARSLAVEAHGAAEQAEAAQALRVADHEVDIAFATALRDATTQVVPLKGEALAVSQKIAMLEKTVEAEKQHVADLTKIAAKASDKDSGDAAQQVALVQAQLDLDNDELDDLHQDLIRLGGDKHAKIQQALDEHETVQKQSLAAPATAVDAESADTLQTLLGKFHALFEIGSRDRDLRQAQEEAKTAIAKLTEQHEDLEKQTEASTTRSGTQPAALASDTINTLHALSIQRKALAELDARVHDEQQLATTYQQWDQLALARKRSILHGIFLALSVIAALLFAALGATMLVRGFFAKRVDERRRLGHLRVVAELAVQLFALIMVLVVIFGPPKQIPAIIGLATAGITIVLKDFIVAFFGWFPLMGKNGLRVGDWVEINGVSGEVVDIGLLRTVLLETGNWADSGHPTGRRVTFMNSFAIEGRYFNFSTSGQWLWDEVRVTVPRGDDAYNRIDAIRKLVTTATEEDASVAELEWRKATKDEALKGFSAAPAVDLRPATDAIEVTVRYITRAQKRYEVRSSLYQSVIQLLHFESAPRVAAPDDAVAAQL